MTTILWHTDVISYGNNLLHIFFLRFIFLWSCRKQNP